MSIWAELAARTDEMLAAARAGDFDRVAALDLERRVLLAAAPPPDAAERTQRASLLERDRDVTALVEIAHARAAEHLHRARQTQAGAGAYLGVARALP